MQGIKLLLASLIVSPLLVYANPAPPNTVSTISNSTNVAQTAVFSLPPGQYAVGFKAVDLYDYTRSYRTPNSITGEIEQHERARPVQTSIWYPAIKTAAAPMHYGDYVELDAHLDGSPTAAKATKFMQDVFKNVQDPKHGISKADIEVVHQTSVSAVRDAAAASGKFPIIIYNAGGGCPSWDNAVLFEYLASHGYVVIASPSTWDWERNRPAGDEYESVEAAARDMEFHIGYARSLPYVDTAHLALMGYSWGGLASPIVALRNPGVSAVVGLDGSITWADKLLAKATHPDPKNMRAAFLSLRSSLERTFQMYKAEGVTVSAKERRDAAKQERIFKFYDKIRYADAYNATMLKFHHGNFASWGTVLNGMRNPPDPMIADDREGYGVMAQYVLTFLDGYVKDDALARLWLQKKPSENGIKDGIIKITSKMASTNPPPTIDGFAHYAKTNGFEKLVALVNSERKKNAKYTLSEETASRWAELLDEEEHKDLGIKVRQWNVSLYPKSATAMTQLCTALTDKSAQQPCWRKALKIDPSNQQAKDELAKLK